MNPNLDWNFLDTSLNIIQDDTVEGYSKEIEELKGQLEIINEDRGRLKKIIKGLMMKNSKMHLHYELVKKVLGKEQLKGQIFLCENEELKKDLDRKNEVLKNFKGILEGLSPHKGTVNKRNSSVGEVRAWIKPRTIRTVVTKTPTGFTKSFYK